MSKQVTVDVVGWKNVTIKRLVANDGTVTYSLTPVFNVVGEDVTHTKTIVVSSTQLSAQAQSNLESLDSKLLAMIKSRMGV